MNKIYKFIDDVNVFEIKFITKKEFSDANMT